MTSQVIGETARGKIRGLTDRGVSMFKGIPYGRSPDGARSRTSVLFPVWRAPVTTVTGITLAAWANAEAASRGSAFML